MKWCIPAKTFLVGEYAALANQSAILLTTTPSFQLTLSTTPGIRGIHADSPAGRWWKQSGVLNHGLDWKDPYEGRGGMGASSAQFLGAYWATSFLNHQPISQSAMLEAYWQCAWNGQGRRPSGYDVLAQSLSECVFINRQERLCQSIPWPFQDVDFMIVHTGLKLATHTHLQTTTVDVDERRLNALVITTREAFESGDRMRLIQSVKAYYHALLDMNLVHENTQKMIHQLNDQPGVLAAKGCGAMGVDTFILLMEKQAVPAMRTCLASMNLTLMATNEMLSTSVAMIEPLAQVNPTQRFPRCIRP